jgi:hypothetical protein
MFSTLAPTDFTAYTWPEDDLAQFKSYIAGLPATPSASGSSAPIGRNGPPADPPDEPKPSGIRHKSDTSRKEFFIAEITKAMEAMKKPQSNTNGSTVEGTLTPKQLGGLNSTQRIIAMKSNALMSMKVIARNYSTADITIGAALFVDFYSDNDSGCSMYSMSKMATFFSRDERTVRDALKRAIRCGVLQRSKAPGGSYRHWPTVFSSLLDPAASTHWYADDSLPVGEFTPAPTGESAPVSQRCNTGERAPGGPERGLRGDRREGSDSFPSSFPTSFSLREGAPAGRSHAARSPTSKAAPRNGARTGKQLDGGQAEWRRHLNPEAAIRAGAAAGAKVHDQ